MGRGLGRGTIEDCGKNKSKWKRIRKIKGEGERVMPSQCCKSPLRPGEECIAGHRDCCECSPFFQPKLLQFDLCCFPRLYSTLHYFTFLYVLSSPCQIRCGKIIQLDKVWLCYAEYICTRKISFIAISALAYCTSLYHCCSDPGCFRT